MAIYPVQRYFEFSKHYEKNRKQRLEKIITSYAYLSKRMKREGNEKRYKQFLSSYIECQEEYKQDYGKYLPDKQEFNPNK